MKKKIISAVGFLGFITVFVGAATIDSTMELSNGVIISLLGLAAMWVSVKMLETVK